MIPRAVASFALLVELAACAADPTPTPVALVPIPTQSPPPPLQIGPEACPGALLESVLVRHDEAGLAVHNDPNWPPTVVVWPHGWSARDAGGGRELLDDAGQVVAREGDIVSAGGGAYPPRDWFHPCGPIDFRSAD